MQRSASPDITDLAASAPLSEPRRPGRPKRNPNPPQATLTPPNIAVNSPDVTEGNNGKPGDDPSDGSLTQLQPLKRGRGRPKRNVEIIQTQSSPSPSNISISPSEQPKRRGRKPKAQNLESQDSEPVPTSEDTAMETSADATETSSTELNKTVELDRMCSCVTPMETDFLPQVSSVSSLFSSVMKSEQPFGSGGGIPGLDLDECEANVTPISTGTPLSHSLDFGFGTSTASASSVAADEYKGTLTLQAPIVKTELTLTPKSTEEGDKEIQVESVKKEDASNEENESSKVRRSSRIKTLEEQRGSRGRRREVVSSLADTSGLSRSSVSLQEDDSNSSSSMQMYGGSSSGYSSPTREGGIGGLLASSSSVPNLSSLSLNSSGSNNGTKPLKVKSRWRNSLDAESMKSFNMSAESISGTITDSVAAMKISVTSLIPEDQIVRRRGHLAFDGKDEELLEKLKKFDGIDESIFRTERKISKENKGMLCDCYLSNEDVMRGDVGCSEDCLNRLLMVECGNKCPTGENCSNKRFQRKEYSSLEVFKTEKKGHGLRTMQYIPEGGFVIEYVGEVLDVPEFERRTSEYAKGNQEHFYFMALKSDAIIDATLRGNCSRFINHSCEPNCETQKWTVNGEVRIGFFAIEDLQPGDEITFDYQFQRYGKKAQKCFCLTESCRGWLGEEDEDAEVAEEEQEETAAEVETEVEDSKVKPKPKVDKNKRKNVQLEDMGFREELGKLETSGLKNRNHTLTLNRLMVRAEGWDDRERLLKILIKGDTPCRRLFLDYHGLRLIWSWMVDLPLPQESDGPQLIRNDVYHMLFLHALQSLPIPNKNLLLESKVIQLVEKWCSVPSVTTTVTLVKRPDVQSDASVIPTATDALISVESGVEKMDISELKEEPTSTAEGMQEVSEEKNWDFVPFSKSLLESWSDLKEVFRIPKKERVEQMKEHEREADKGLLNALNQPSSNYSYDRDHRNKQFRNRGERRVPVLDSTQPQYHRYPARMALPPGVTKEEFRLRFEQSVRQQEEQELLRKQQDALVNLHQERCALVGLDPATTPIVDPHGIHYLDPKSVMWKPINIEDPMLPPELVKFVQLSQYPPVETTEPPPETPVEPEEAFPPWPPGLPPPPPLPPRELPTNWNMAVDDEGRCYYYHIRTRVTRWDPPTVEDVTESESSGCSSEEEVEEDEKGSPSLTKASIQTWHTKIIERTARRKKSGLVEERIISPRGDDEKGFSKEMVKENKKKVLEEKKLAMKEANLNKSAKTIEPEVVATGDAISDEIPVSDVPSEGLQTSSEKKSTAPVKKRRKEKPTGSKGASTRKHKQKPIASIPTAEENLVSSSPIETELDLTLSQQSLDEESDGFFSRVSAGPSIISSTASMDVVKIPGLGFDSRDIDARKKADKVARHAAKKKALAMHKKIKEKTEAGSSSGDKKLSSKEANSIKDSFRNSIATVVVAHLNPYRKSEHIKNTDDFKHLARKITHAILLKELKHTRDVTSLEVTDSVKHKTKEYIRKFMARFPNGIYIRSPENPQP